MKARKTARLIGKGVSDRLDNDVEFEIPSKKISYKPRNLFISFLFAVIFVGLGMLLYHTYIYHNPRINQLTVVYLDDPRYEGLEGYMYVDFADGDSAEDLKTALFVGELEGDFFGQRAQAIP